MMTNEFEAKIMQLCEQVNRIDVAIRGNGEPGIKTRLDRLERSEVVRSRLQWIVAAATVSLILGQLWRFFGI